MTVTLRGTINDESDTILMAGFSSVPLIHPAAGPNPPQFMADTLISLKGHPGK